MSLYKRLNAVKNESLSDINFSKDAQKHRSRKKWKKNREEFLNGIDTCAWCNDQTDDFDIHHEWGKSFSREWMKAADEAFLDSSMYSEELTDNRIACPECFSMNYTARKTKNPKYRCSDCKATFKAPKEYDGKIAILRENIPNKPYTTKAYLKAKVNWVENHTEIVHDVFTDRYADMLDEYTDLRDDQCVAICSSCHYKEEQTNLRRCKNCGQEWHKRNKEMCWECLVDKENLVECACGNGWYSSDTYDACSDCR